jgi:hypothetical protein
MIVLFALFVILLLTLIWITHTPVRELFTDATKEPAIDRKSVDAVAKLLDIKEGEPVDPHIVFGKLRGLIDKYDNPDFTKHIQHISGLDPGQLARMQL